MRVITMSILMSCAGCGAGGSTDEVPISLLASSGSTRYTVEIQIGDDPPMQVLLDTGSSGLRVLSPAVSPSAAPLSETPVTYSYHSGLVMTGVVATADVHIGGRTARAIPIMVTEEIGCAATRPTCSAAGKTVDDYMLFGPFRAVLGVGLRNGATSQGVASPFAQLDGHPSFAIRSPDYGGDAAVLDFAPDPSVFASYTLPQQPSSLPDGTPSWDDRYGLPACLHDRTAGVDYCLPAELDSGNPTTYVEWAAHDGAPSTLAAGTEVGVELGPTAAPLASYQFVVGETQPLSADVVEIEAASGNAFMNTGTAAFFHNDVLYDPQHGTIGLLPRR
jgi:hypothetical protein